MNLPKNYLSHTQMSLWLKSPEQYKQQYFEGHRFEPTPYMRHGQAIAKLIEQNHESVRFVPRLRYPEHEIRTIIAGVPTLSYLDSFENHPRFSFLEYKCSKNPWDQKMVDASQQMLFYSAAIRAAYGSLPKTAHLVWLHTRLVTAVPDPRGVVWEEDVIELDGSATILERKIIAEEVDNFEQEIVTVAQQISEALVAFQK